MHQKILSEIEKNVMEKRQKRELRHQLEVQIMDKITRQYGLAYSAQKEYISDLVNRQFRVYSEELGNSCMQKKQVIRKIEAEILSYIHSQVISNMFY